ncbi:unconventional myosin-XVIIIb isoform X1 [Sigmodon hispidus]
MAISSRLALWEQKESGVWGVVLIGSDSTLAGWALAWIREEDKSPPPSSPPPLFSVIPGGFIKQLVRETEKESKEARRRKEAAFTSPEGETPEISTNQANKTNNVPKPGGQQTSQDNPSATQKSTDIPGKERPGADDKNSTSVTSPGEERPQESGPTGTPAKRTLPLKRGVRRGDVLLMVAKLDPELAKPEQKTQARDTLTDKTPVTATDSGGTKKGATKGTPHSSRAPIPEKTRTGGDGGTSQGTKGGKCQGIEGKGGQDPQTKGQKECESQSTEGQGTGFPVQEAGSKGQMGTSEKGGGGGEPAKKTAAKGDGPKDAGAELRPLDPPVPIRKWGGPLGRRTKNRESESQGREEKVGDLQSTAEPRQPQQKTPGTVEKVGRPQKKSVTPEQRQEQPGASAEPKSPEDSCKASGGPPTEGTWTEASRRKDQPESRVQGAEEPRVHTEEQVDLGEPREEGSIEPVPKPQVEKPSTQKPTVEKPGLQDPGCGGQSGDSDQASEDSWYEAQKVWLVQKDGFTLATVLKPDEGTADLPAGRVRLCIEADKTVTEVDEEQVHRANPSELDQAEDLASLVSVNESSVLNILLQRYKAQLPHTRSGPDLIALQPQRTTVPAVGKQVLRGRQDGLPAHVTSLAQRAYWALLSQRRDQSIVALGRSGAGKTTCCEQVLEHLVGMAGSVDGRVTVEKLQAAFTVLRAFGSVSTGHSRRATRFAMVASLDFSATGRVTAAQLQTMLLENSRVARQPQGEGNFEVFSQLLAGLDVDLRTELNLHQMAESSAFGMGVWSQPEDKQKAAAGFSQLRGAMELLGILEGEQRAIWRVLAAIYHLGAAGACKVGRKQFMRFEWANHAAEALGCDYEELNAATFKHHLRQIIQQMTSGPQRQGLGDNDACSGLKMTGVECVEGMASGLYQELFVAVVSLINRSFSSHHLSMASIMVVDSPGFQNPRHQGKDRAATFEELCYNYAQERLQLLFYHRTFVSTLERYQEEGIPVRFDLPESSPGTTVAVVDHNPSQIHLPAGRGAEDARGLFWVLDEEVQVEGSSDSMVLEHLRAAFEKKAVGIDGPPVLRTCEQSLQCELFHQLGRDPVRYDLTGWLRKAKPNLSALEAPQLLQQSKREELQNLFQARAKLPPICRAVAGLEGTSQQALHRSRVVRRAFASSVAALKRKAPCAQIKLQMDALISLLSRSRLHFIHCLVPTSVESRTGQGAPSSPQPGGDQGGANETPALDIPALRVQLAGSHILEALRLHRAGYIEHMELSQFRRRFQVLDPPLLKKLDLTSERLDERKAVEELLQTLDLEKKAVAVGHSQVFLKAGVVSRLERRREKLVSRNIVLFQAACRGFLSRQEYKKLKIRRLASQCIQKNLAVFLEVKDWPWWVLLASLRPLLSPTLSIEQLRAKEEELTLLRQKLQKSEKLRSELRHGTDLLESKITDLTSELADERFKGDMACQVLESERAERLQAFREVQELKAKYQQVQEALGKVEKQLEQAQQKSQLAIFEEKPAAGEDEWQMRLDCAQMENDFLRKRLQQCEERLDSEMKARTELEQKLGELQNAYEEAKKMAHQLKRKCHHLTWDLEDTRVLLENQQSRNHELEKKQRKFDLQLAKALGESMFEKTLREKVSQENSGVRWELGQLQQQLEQKEQEASRLKQEVERLQGQKQELLGCASVGAQGVASLKERVWELESSTLEQKKVHSQQENTIKQLEQLHQRFELEIERMKQMHQKDREDQEEELEDVRQSCQKRLRQLEMQLEQEYEEKQMALHEKRDLEGLIGTLCDQIGHRDFDVEKRLRRDLRRTHALLSDVQLLLATMEDSKTSVSKEELEKVQSQEATSGAAKKEATDDPCCFLSTILQGVVIKDFEAPWPNLEHLSCLCVPVHGDWDRIDERKKDLPRSSEEDTGDPWQVLRKNRVVCYDSVEEMMRIATQPLGFQRASDCAGKHEQILSLAELQMGSRELSLYDRALPTRKQAMAWSLKQRTQEGRVRIKRFTVLMTGLNDMPHSKLGCCFSTLTPIRQELKASSAPDSGQTQVSVRCQQYRQRMAREKYVEELSAVRQTLQTDLETSIRRIADLQAALEEVASSDSDTESVQTAVDCGSRSRKEEDNVSVISSQAEGSLQSWMSCSLSLATDTMRTPSQQSAVSSPLLSTRVNEEAGDAEKLRPASLALSGAWDTPRQTLRGDSLSLHPAFPQKPYHLGDGEGFAVHRKTTPEQSSQSMAMSPLPRDKLPSPSAALSEFVEELRRKRAQRGQGSSLHLGEGPTLPIFQTIGASSLRRGRARSDEGDLSLRTGAKSPLGAEGKPRATGGLSRSTSLKCISSEGTENVTLLPDNQKTRFGSCDSLLESGPSTRKKLSSPMALRDPVLSPTLRPRRPCLESSVDDAGCLDLGKEPLVFQNRQFSHLMEETLDSDPFSWKLPSLNYRRQTKVDFDDFLPAIRKPSSPLSDAAKDEREASKQPNVHFETEEADRSFLSGIKTILKKSAESKEDPARLSDSSSSSSSITSFKSTDSIKSGPRVPRLQGDGGEQMSPEHREPGTARKSDDVESIMRKYLQQ